MPHLISVEDLTDDELYAIVERAAQFADGLCARPLEGKVVGVHFRRTSTRTRVAFSSGALRLGAQIVTLGPDDLQTSTGETVADTARVLSRMLDALVLRTAAPAAELVQWARQDRMAVINAMTTEEHPTQALADLTTMHRHFGRISGLRVLYVGEGNNSAAALALALTRCPGTSLELRTPPGYGLSGEVRAAAAAHARLHGASLTESHDLDELPGDFDVIYTTRWQTTGTSKADPAWRHTFAPFQVHSGLWRTSPRAVFMHDLPAHRGEEVTAEVLDGPFSIAFDQSENKLYSAMAVLEHCAGASPAARSRRQAPGALPMIAEVGF